jgi:hypothetical protein
MSIRNSVERGDNFLLTASPEQLAQLTRDVKSSYEFFMTSPLLFGDDCITVNGLRDFKMLRRHVVHFLTRAHAQYPNQGFQTILTRFDRKRKIIKPLIDKLCDEIVRGDIPFIPGFDARARCTELLPTTLTRVLGHEKDPKNVNNSRRALILSNTLKQRASEAGFPTLSAQAHTKRYVARLVTALNRRARRCRRDLHRAVRASSPAQSPASPLDLSTAQGRLIAWLKRSPARMRTPDSDAALRLNCFLGRAHRTAAWPAVLNAANQALRIARQGTSDIQSATVVSLNIASAHAHLASTIALADAAVPTLFAGHNRSTDIFLLQETLSESLPIARSLGYATFAQARADGARGGGTAVITRSYLSPVHLQTASHQSSGVDEAEWLTVQLETYPSPVTLVSLYRPPNCSEANDIALSTLFADQLGPLAATGSLLVGCDLNVDFDRPRPSDSRPINIWRPVLHRLGVLPPIKPVFPTAIRTTRIGGNAVIDYLFAKVPTPINRCHLRAFASDHYALIALVPKLLTFIDLPLAINWRKAIDDPAQMAAVVERTVSVLTRDANSITTATQLIDSINSGARELLGPVRDRSSLANRRETWRKADWWTSDQTAIVNAVRRDSRRIVELSAKLRSRPGNAIIAANLAARRAQLRTNSELLAVSVRNAKTDHFNKMRSDLNPSYVPDIRQAHKWVRSFSARPPTKSIPFKPEAMKAAWTNILGPTLARNIYDPTNKFQQFNATIEQLKQAQPEYDLQFTAEQIHAAMNKLPSNKAPGPDQVPNAFWRAFGAVGPVHAWLARYITDLLTNPERRIEPVLQLATVVLIPKKDAPESETDYRPISLLNTISKLIELVIFERIKPRLEGRVPLRDMPHDLYDPLTPLEQAGFTTGRNIAQQALLTRLARERASRHKHKLYITGYDQAKAFDSAQLIEIALSMANSQRWHWRECLFALSWMTGQTR